MNTMEEDNLSWVPKVIMPAALLGVVVMQYSIHPRSPEQLMILLVAVPAAIGVSVLAKYRRNGPAHWTFAKMEPWRWVCVVMCFIVYTAAIMLSLPCNTNGL
jgi:hypothetical protein